MANKKVANDVVTAMIDSAEAYYRTSIGDEDREILIAAGEDGRLSIEDGTITVHLISPIELANGQSVTEFNLEEPTAVQISQSTGAKGVSEFDQMLKLLSFISGHPVGVIERMKSRDLKVVGAAANFFG